MITAAKIFAANIAGIYYRVSDDSFVFDSKQPHPTLAVKCKIIKNDTLMQHDENNVVSNGHYFVPKFDKSSIEQCRKIGKALADKKYSGPLDRYINGLTGVAIKSPPESHGEAKAKKPKYHYLRSFKVGIPRKEFAEDDVPALDAALGILFGVQQIVINVSPDDRVKDYFENELKWCGTCYKKIEQFEIAHGLARKHHQGKSDTDPENLYRTCFDCNRTMIDEHILHYQHKLDSERKGKYYFNTPKARLGDRVMKDMYDIHKKLNSLGVESNLNTYDDPLEIYRGLIIKNYLVSMSQNNVNNQKNNKCCIL